MEFKKVALLFEELEKTASGNDLRLLLSSFLKELTLDEISVVVYLCLGRLGPEYDDVVLGFAEKTVLRALSRASGVSEKKVDSLMVSLGDAGLVAEQVLATKPRTLVPVESLSIHDLYEGLVKISRVSGSRSVDLKSDILVSLLGRCSGVECKYVVRVALGTIRLGVAEMTVIDSLAMAFIGSKKDKVEVERAYMVCPDLGYIASVLCTSGVVGLQRITATVGRPVKMMLAQRVTDLDEIEDKMPGSVLVEAKYDGERVQVHRLADGSVRLFSRQLQDITSQFPDLVSAVKSHVKCNSCIVEGEILAMGEDGRPLAFQTLMQRRRKNDVADFVLRIPVVLKLFDVLYVDSVVVMDLGLVERKKWLNAIIISGGALELATNMVTDDVYEIDTYFKSMLAAGYEGVIVKNLDGSYQAGQRGWNWIKWKKEYAGELVDTFDVVVVGAFFGKGKRSGGYGALLCAVYDSSSEKFLSFCKLGTGLSDAVLGGLGDVLDKYRLKEKAKNVESGIVPDVWFSPAIVCEISGAEITRSPLHASGFALRFPRFLRFREKKASDATTLAEVKEMGAK